jgi:hypothetical protein
MFEQIRHYVGPLNRRALNELVAYCVRMRPRTRIEIPNPSQSEFENFDRFVRIVLVIIAVIILTSACY